MAKRNENEAWFIEAKRLYLEENLSLSKLEEKLGKSRKTIAAWFEQFNVREINYKDSSIIFDEEKILKLYNENKYSLTKIGEILNIDRHVISKYLKSINVEVINRQNITKFNQHIFDKIDTEEKAYWLGFIYADGYIESHDEGKKDRFGFELSLGLKDIIHLQKFANFMEHPTNLKEDSYRCRFCIVNKHLWHTLNNYGCTPRKSLILEFPNENIFKSEDLIKHFIRGYFDGDGCLSYQKYKTIDGNIYVPSTSFLGTLNFLSKLSEYINVDKNMRKANKTGSNQCLTFSLAKKESINFLQLIYENSSIYLDRKYARYLLFKNNNFAVQESNFLDNNWAISEEAKEFIQANTEIIE